MTAVVAVSPSLSASDPDEPHFDHREHSGRDTDDARSGRTPHRTSSAHRQGHNEGEAPSSAGRSSKKPSTSSKRAPASSSSSAAQEPPMPSQQQQQPPQPPPGDMMMAPAFRYPMYPPFMPMNMMQMPQPGPPMMMSYATSPRGMPNMGPSVVGQSPSSSTNSEAGSVRPRPRNSANAIATNLFGAPASARKGRPEQSDAEDAASSDPRAPSSTIDYGEDDELELEDDALPGDEEEGELNNLSNMAPVSAKMVRDKLTTLQAIITERIKDIQVNTVYEILNWIGYPVQVMFSNIHSANGEFYMSTRSIGEFVLHLLHASMPVKTNVTTTIVRKFKSLDQNVSDYGLLVKTVGQKPEKVYMVQKIPIGSHDLPQTPQRGRGSHTNSRGTTFYWPVAYIPRIMLSLVATINRSRAFKDIQPLSTGETEVVARTSTPSKSSSSNSAAAGRTKGQTTPIKNANVLSVNKGSVAVIKSAAAGKSSSSAKSPASKSQQSSSRPPPMSPLSAGGPPYPGMMPQMMMPMGPGMPQMMMGPMGMHMGMMGVPVMGGMVPMVMAQQQQAAMQAMGQHYPPAPHQMQQQQQHQTHPQQQHSSAQQQQRSRQQTQAGGRSSVKEPSAASQHESQGQSETRDPLAASDEDVASVQDESEHHDDDQDWHGEQDKDGEGDDYAERAPSPASLLAHVAVNAMSNTTPPSSAAKRFAGQAEGEPEGSRPAKRFALDRAAGGPEDENDRTLLAKLGEEEEHSERVGSIFQEAAGHRESSMAQSVRGDDDVSSDYSSNPARAKRHRNETSEETANRQLLEEAEGTMSDPDSELFDESSITQARALRHTIREKKQRLNELQQAQRACQKRLLDLENEMKEQHVNITGLVFEIAESKVELHKLRADNKSPAELENDDDEEEETDAPVELPDVDAQ
ncbi:hypothetical protein CAOG_01368 [Capsaspora owczarzaki ATCC 30864]|uniref:Uncharacterized protein n=1 Tax=Capsaspora owczarzaki (strain ATCC 30864) TaxID=595528 RepID=A0A0D2WK87_CAPO3|nr:hypothetical protein CAOG_01368 [Capsaspora owczarzaki ATCC 30864]KJE89978.1 hypothetical protein CAOG_001368 [Capsaspora owczarzaki ATCC 30864]|eukprot:XP_004349888.1 hypothetical protein CAOG_01368 [Capsaspora owczarzaki ATCC 30864]